VPVAISSDPGGESQAGIGVFSLPRDESAELVIEGARFGQYGSGFRECLIEFSKALGKVVGVFDRAGHFAGYWRNL
jgi:hypothetical protein